MPALCAVPRDTDASGAGTFKEMGRPMLLGRRHRQPQTFACCEGTRSCFCPLNTLCLSSPGLRLNCHPLQGAAERPELLGTRACMTCLCTRTTHACMLPKGAVLQALDTLPFDLPG